MALPQTLLLPIRSAVDEFQSCMSMVSDQPYETADLTTAFVDACTAPIKSGLTEEAIDHFLGLHSDADKTMVRAFMYGYMTQIRSIMDSLGFRKEDGYFPYLITTINENGVIMKHFAIQEEVSNP